MQKTRNNCLGSKKRKMAIYQAKIGKRDYGKRAVTLKRNKVIWLD